jgi:hypothetical protein
MPVHSNYFSRPKIFRANFFRFGRNFPKSANSSAEQWTKFAQIGRISPEIFEGETQLRGFAHFEQVSPKKNITVYRNNFFLSWRLGDDEEVGHMYHSNGV